MNPIVNQQQIILMCSKALQFYDIRLIDHGTRVAYIAGQILPYLPSDLKLEFKQLFLLGVFHDIGAYKTEEVDRLVQFETANVDAHSIYGYLFLKHLSPLGKNSKAVLYHHTPYKDLINESPTINAYSQLLHIADRIDIAILNSISKERIISSLSKTGYFDQLYIDAFERALIHNPNLYHDCQTVAFDWANRVLLNLEIDEEEAKEFLNMVIYSIDFKSLSTMLHSINTTTISVFIGKIMGLSERDLNYIYYGAFVHDIGKVAIPDTILEHPGRLNSEQMEIMRKHIIFSEEILSGIFNSEVVNIAIRHHEKLDGSGYPYGLKAEDLSLSERIVAVADIVSALTASRSYKEAYEWSTAYTILSDMASKNLLDADIVSHLSDCWPQLQAELDMVAGPVIAKYEAVQNEYKQLMA